MSTKKVTPAAKKAVKPKVTLKQLISRTEKVANDAATLLGDLRTLDRQGFVITTLQSGSSKVPNA